MTWLGVKEEECESECKAMVSGEVGTVSCRYPGASFKRVQSLKYLWYVVNDDGADFESKVVRGR